MAIIEHYRARQAAAGRVVAEPARLLRQRRGMGHRDLPVPDSLDSLVARRTARRPSSRLLLPTLPDPTACRFPELGLVRRWASNWAPLVSMQPLPGDAAATFVVDLMQDAGLRTSNECPHRNLRRLDTSRLAMQINQRGSNCSKAIPPMHSSASARTAVCAQCHRLLKRLYKPWCDVARRTPVPPPPRGRYAKVCYGLRRHALPHLAARSSSNRRTPCLFTPGLRQAVRFSPHARPDTDAGGPPDPARSGARYLAA
jgi:hypothetical protein